MHSSYITINHYFIAYISIDLRVSPMVKCKGPDAKKEGGWGGGDEYFGKRASLFTS